MQVQSSAIGELMSIKQGSGICFVGETAGVKLLRCRVRHPAPLEVRGLASVKKLVQTGVHEASN